MNTSINIDIKPLSVRIAQIAIEVESTKQTYRFYDFRDDSKDLPVIRIPISTLVYRVANYRTNLLQLRYIRETSAGVSFFSQGEENESIQRIQHAFLWALAKSETESLTSIVYTLKREGQRLPLLISSSGIVVNGNRRLAAMRELFVESAEDNSNFAYVDCMVLPETADEDDLKDIEVRLQMTPETRLPYGWINECIAIKDLQQRGRSLDNIGQLMRLEASRVKDKLLMLEEIDLYLKDWQSNLDYDSLSDAEEIITQITSRLRKKEGTQKEISRRIGWILLEQRGKDGRVYDLREATGNLSEAVTNKLQEEYNSEIFVNREADEAPELDFNRDEPTSSDQDIITFLESSKDDEQKQLEIVNICRIVIEAKKNQNLGSAALKSVKEAHTKLIEVDLSTADRGTYNAIKNQLIAITTKVQFLENELTKYVTN